MVQLQQVVFAESTDMTDPIGADVDDRQDSRHSKLGQIVVCL
ncbi:hypothetical protein [Burkholderia anthina]|nr:hypothetical protein [Burkholderia anthina]